MAEAAPRDRIARAYVTGFADITGIGLPALAEARALGLDAAWTASAVHLAYLAAVPDSHVLRKHGSEVADAVRESASALRERIDWTARPVAQLLVHDAQLKDRGINPGTSADFTVATLFWRHLVDQGAAFV